MSIRSGYISFPGTIIELSAHATFFRRYWHTIIWKTDSGHVISGQELVFLRFR